MIEIRIWISNTAENPPDTGTLVITPVPTDIYLVIFKIGYHSHPFPAFSHKA